MVQTEGKLMSDRSDVLEANARFYRAFQTKSLEAMDQIWAEGEVSCVHPGWPALESRQAILNSYRLILTNAGQDPVLCLNPRIHLRADQALVICEEQVGGGMLVASNLYLRTQQGWRLVHHQASPMMQSAPKPERGPLN
jgi:hypothetical protein